MHARRLHAHTAHPRNATPGRVGLAPEMTPALNVKPLLKRGALVAAANWEAVVLQFIAESAFKLLLVVPLVAAAFLVALLVGWQRARRGHRRYPARSSRSCSPG